VLREFAKQDAARCITGIDAVMRAFEASPCPIDTLIVNEAHHHSCSLYLYLSAHLPSPSGSRLCIFPSSAEFVLLAGSARYAIRGRAWSPSVPR
jgi:hypothetical protein